MRFLLLLVTLTLALPAGSPTHSRTVAPAIGVQKREILCFDQPGIINCIEGRFREYWEQNGGLAVFGYPLSAAQERQTAEGTFLTQIFQRNRFEFHSDVDAPYDVLLGRLGDDLLRDHGRDWRTLPAGQQTGACLWFPETHHSVCDQETGIGFKTFWSTHGLADSRLNSYGRSLALFGLPLTEPVMEKNQAGDTVLTQWFERARLEYHPGQPQEFRVLLGLLGQEITGPPPPASAPPIDPSTIRLALAPVVRGLSSPLHITNAADGSGRLFVVEKAGRIRIISRGNLLAQPFLDISPLVLSRGSEQGLFAVAFHPNYRTNGIFFVHYSNQNGDTVIARYRVSSDPDRADPASGTKILGVDQPASNHNGGQIAFGPDGYLYIGLGDGGGVGDPQGNGQNRSSLLGKILRLDVDRGEPYAIPADNPFRTLEGVRPEIWALGLRNPWRFSFDRATGDLFIADVGQGVVEEVDFQPAASKGGENFGWNAMEGSRCYKPATGCNRNGLVLPVAEYGHDLGCSITGGFRYRGAAVPSFGSTYFFGDYCTGRLWGLAPATGGTWKLAELLDSNLSVSSFGEDEQGELYVTDLSGGGIYRLAAQQ